MAGYNGDNIPARSAQLNNPTDIALDRLGNLFIADHENNRIRKVDSNGIITTIVGDGTEGNSGDGGPAIYAQIHWPLSVAVDSDGNVYVSDEHHYGVRKIDIRGIINTIVGTGSYGYSGDGGPASEAQVSRISDVTFDRQGNLFLADMDNNVVRKVDQSGLITTIAGCRTCPFTPSRGDGGPALDALLHAPRQVTVDKDGNLFVVQDVGQVVRRVDTSGIISTMAGTWQQGYNGDGIPATQAELNTPCDIAIDNAGHFLIADAGNHRIRKVAPQGLHAQVPGDGGARFAARGLYYEMDAAGLHQRTVDPETDTILNQFGYNSDDHLVTVSDRFGNQVIIQRNVQGMPEAIVSPDGIVTLLTIDSGNLLNRIDFADGSYYAFEYQVDGLMTAEIDPNGNRYEHIYNENGRLTDVLDEAAGHDHYTNIAYPNGDVVTQRTTGEANWVRYRDRTTSSGDYQSTITASTGVQTIYERSVKGLSAATTMPCGTRQTLRFGIDPRDKTEFVREMTVSQPSGLTQVTQRSRSYEDTDLDGATDQITDTVTLNSRTTIFHHNLLESQKQSISPEGRTITSHYDPVTLLVSRVSVPGLHDTIFGYDKRGRQISISQGTRQVSFSYHSDGSPFAGNLSSITNAGQTTTYDDYDPLGRLRGVLRADSSHISYGYDDNGNLDILTVPRSVDHAFEYNRINLKSAYHTPISGSYLYTYDRDRELISVDYPSGKQQSYAYVNGLLDQTVMPHATVGHTYTCGNRPDIVTMGMETVDYDYDGQLLVRETIDGTLEHILTYTYFDDFSLESIGYAGGSVSFAYDQDGLLTGAGDFTLIPNPDNGLIETVQSDAYNLSRTFNNYGEIAGQALAVGGTPLFDWSLTHDDQGLIETRTENIDGQSIAYAYQYDAAARLLTVTRNGALVEAYTYYPDGTRQSETNTLRGINERSYAYSDEDHLLSAAPVHYSYGPDGYLVARTGVGGQTSYTYSVRGELLTVVLPDGRIVEYRHDPLGRRIAKLVDGLIVAKYLWQGMTRLLAVYDGSDTLIQRFAYADERVPLSMSQDGKTYYLGCDQVGSLRIVTDTSGNVVRRIEYDAFGNIVEDTNSAFELPFGFAGGLHDLDTGLVRFGYRDYDPDTGRWTAKDPIGFSGGDTDLYGYVQNNPVNWVDPWGLEVLSPDMTQNIAPDVNPQEVADLTSSGMMMGGGTAIMAGGAGIVAAGAVETGSIAAGNPVGWTGPHTMAEGGMMMGAGAFITLEGWKQFKKYWEKYYQPPEDKDPCP